MKAIRLFSFVLLCIGCTNQSPSKTGLNLIIGTYVTKGRGEFSQVSDTLVISVYNENAQTFTIQRNTGFNRIVQDKLQKSEFHSEKMVAIFEDKNQQLREIKEGRIFSFPQAKNRLMFGSEIYNKIK